MASKSGNLDADKGAAVDELLDTVESLLDRVKVLYEQYFLGIQKQAPSYLHNDLERKIRDLSQLQLRNTALRYRLATVQQKFGSYNTYWRRTLRQIENGTYSRSLSRVGRQAARTGEAIPEEILAAMPRRMREQVSRDREIALAVQKRRGADAKDGALVSTSDATLDLAPMDDDFEIDIEEAALEDVATIHSRAPVVHAISEDDDVDVDALFAAITESEPKAPAPRTTARGVMPVATPIDSPPALVARTTAPGVAFAPVARGAAPRWDDPADRVTSQGLLAPEPPPAAPAASRGGDEDAPTYRASRPAGGARAATDPGMGAVARAPSARPAEAAEPPAPFAAAAQRPAQPAPRSAPAAPPAPPPRTPAPRAATASPAASVGQPAPAPSASPPAPVRATPAPSAASPPAPVRATPAPSAASTPAPARATPAPSAASPPAPVRATPAPSAPDAAPPPSAAAAAGAAAPSTKLPISPPRPRVVPPSSIPPIGGKPPPKSEPLPPPPARGKPAPSIPAIPSIPRPPATNAAPPPPRPANPAPAAASRPLPKGVSQAEVSRLYDEYVRARTKVGESSDDRTYDRLLRTIEQQAPKIMEEHRAQGVEFQVVVKDNQVILRAKPKP